MTGKALAQRLQNIPLAIRVLKTLIPIALSTKLAKPYMLANAGLCTSCMAQLKVALCMIASHPVDTTGAGRPHQDKGLYMCSVYSSA